MKLFVGRWRAKRWLWFGSLASVVAVFSGCRTVGFYTQAAKGQFQILANREPIARLIADPETPARLKGQLELVEKLRVFAEQELKLPINGHYAKYVDVHRPYVLWNIQAAPRFSLEPKRWWYPLVGSLEYRGYFTERGATNYARSLAAKGYDVSVSGVDAYSTLGWFTDPVLNTFVYRSEPELAEILFHELGHQRVFAGGDTDFNEAFATTVGQEGARRWLQARGNTNLYDAYLVSLQRNDQFVHLILNARAKLEKIYGDTRDEDGRIKAAKKPPATPDELAREKQRVFDQLRRDHARLKAELGGSSFYDGWLARDLNNAQLNTIANYYDFVPGFERLLELKGGDLEQFYAAVEKLAEMDRDERHQWLRTLAAIKPGERITRLP